MRKVYPVPERQPATETFITVEKQAQNLQTALEAANYVWAEHPESADYTITITILGVEYPLFINAIDVVEPLYTAIDEIISIAAENQW